MNTKKDIESLKRTERFCAAPWMHLHVQPEGAISPCCMWDYTFERAHPQQYGDWQDTNNVQAAMNVPAFQNLRKQLLNNEYQDGCARCYDREKTVGDSGVDNFISMRQWFNQRFLDQDMIDRTEPDGYLPDISLKYIDIRFSNICNLKCRMCGHKLSSTWYDEELKMAELHHHDPPPNKFIQIDAYDDLEPHLETVEEIYFAGGEPLLYPEHLKILQRLIELGRTNVDLKYNTNLTSLTYKRVDILELWKKFDRVQIGASIDATGDTVEYIRTKLNWNKFVENFDKIKREAPQIDITPSPTVGILNIEKLPEFECFAWKKGWQTEFSFGLNYVMHPPYLNIYNMPKWYKQEMTELFEKHLEWCNERNLEPWMTGKIKELIVRLEHDVDDAEVDIQMTTMESMLNLWDKTGGLDWRASLPHIDRLIAEHKRRKNEK